MKKPGLYAMIAASALMIAMNIHRMSRPRPEGASSLMPDVSLAIAAFLLVASVVALIKGRSASGPT